MLSQKQEQGTLTRGLKVPETGTGARRSPSNQSVLLVVASCLQGCVCGSVCCGDSRSCKKNEFMHVVYFTQVL